MNGNGSLAKRKYRDFCTKEPSIPIFSKDWWLDAVTEEGYWDVVVVEQGGQVVGSMPFYVRKRWGLRMIALPQLTQTLGPWIRTTRSKDAKMLAQQKDIMESMIEQLPSFDHFSQFWHFSQTNWLPFYWRGFQQKTAYTYILPNLDDEEKLWTGLQSNIRTDIKKALNRHGLRVRDDLDIADFLHLNRMTFSRQALELPYTESLVYRLDAACADKKCRKILIAEDAEGRRHAGVYIVWDTNSAYYLMGAGNPELRNSGATSLCMWEAIKLAATVTKRFDFEGSMIEPIERFFRAFGAIQTPYFQITKTPSFLLRARQALWLLKKGD